jgi:TRAP-type uncharacterized transport system fused permease subunit
VVLAVLSAPALVGLMLSPEMAMLLNAGIEVPEATMYFLSAHLIIFWLSQDSNLTPPVCLAAFAAAGIAGTSPMRTGVMSWKLGKGLYIMPLLFAFTPLITGTWAERFEIFAFSFVGLAAFAIAIEGFWDVKTSWLERFVFGATAVLLFTQDSVYGIESFTPWIENVHIIGVASFIGIMAFHKIRAKKVQHA